MRDGAENTFPSWPRPKRLTAPEPHELRKTVGERLRGARRATTMSLQMAAREGKFSITSLELWESGEVLPDLYILVRLACLQDASADWLLGITVESRGFPFTRRPRRA